MLYLVLFCQVLICAVLLILILHFLSSLVGGLSFAPYVPTPKAIAKHMVDLANIQPGTKTLELGSGDGRITIEAVSRGANGLGLEMDPVLVASAKFRAWRLKLSDRVRFQNVDIWKYPWPADTQVIFVYGLPKFMERVWGIAQKTFKPGTIIVSHAFQIPGVQPEKTQGVVRIYRLP